MASHLYCILARKRDEDKRSPAPAAGGRAIAAGTRNTAGANGTAVA
ncbi:hypothetical protein FTUN_5208 [Frigoriglobus tundricola]|uniref:Uncharacterized protein n=1 Tax=Frigoriglobus tundricola TaxID=2774151 RepID=A0A6M5YWP6_9BACT|nr:hypothetical protein FTUN_5208 [Frigoriglobus tundricola]